MQQKCLYLNSAVNESNFVFDSLCAEEKKKNWKYHKFLAQIIIVRIIMIYKCLINLLGSLAYWKIAKM